MTWMNGESTFSWRVPHRLFDPAHAPRALVVALHGYGRDDVAMARRLASLESAPFRLLVPRAPFPVEIRGREGIRIGHAWYQYDGDDERFVASMERAAGYLLPLAREAANGLPVVLLGFSQGAYLAYYVAIRHAPAFRAVVGVAGRAKAEVLGPHLEAARGTRVLHLHGADDTLVSAAACRASIETLASAGLDATFRRVRGGHELTGEMLDIARDWIEEAT